jgi:hypothetical protein
MSMGTPVIISDWPILRQTFYKGAIYVENSEESIRQGILRMIKDKEVLDKKIYELKNERMKLYKEKINDLRKLMNLCTTT